MPSFSQISKKYLSGLDLVFFGCFLATSMLSIRKVLFFYPIGGQFNEWTGSYLYLSDIFLALTVISWIIPILQNNTATLSIAVIKLWLTKALIILPLILVAWSFASIFWSENQNIALFRAIKLLEMYFLYLYIIYRVVPMFHPGTDVPRGTSYGAGVEQKTECHPERSEGSRFNTASSNSTGFLAKLGMTYLLPIRTFIVLGFIQAIIGIWQFIIQHSIGLFWLKESLISPNIDGVAKIVFHGEKFIRVYGLFPHPNILGGFLLISIILTWAYFRMLHPDMNVPRLPRETKMFHVEHFNVSWGGTMARLILAIQVIALILTFSKSAVIGLLIAMFYIIWKNTKKVFRACPVNCSTPVGMFHVKHPTGQAWNNFYGVKQLIISLFIIVLLAYISLNIAGLNFGDNLNKSVTDRLDQWNVSPSLNCSTPEGINLFHPKRNVPRPPAGEAGGTSYGAGVEHPTGQAWNKCDYKIFRNLISGFGSGQYVMELYRSTNGSLETWQYQPIHNVFLLILAELGFVGFSVFAFFLYKLLKSRGLFHVKQSLRDSTQILLVFKGILLGFIFIMIFDHYLWDIQQGQIMLWIMLGLVAGIGVKNGEK